MRGPTCIRAFNWQVAIGNVKSVAEGLDICNLNGKLDSLCKALQGARRLVQETNWRVCAQQVLVYTPRTYSSSNQDFVRGTVVSFYELFRQMATKSDASSTTVDDCEGDEFYAFCFIRTTPYDELVCPLDDMELQLKVRNDALKSTCSSTQFTTLKEVLRILRKIVNTIVEISYCVMQMFVCLFRLPVPMGGEVYIQAAITELTFWFNKIIESSNPLLQRANATQVYASWTCSSHYPATRTGTALQWTRCEPTAAKGQCYRGVCVSSRHPATRTGTALPRIRCEPTAAKSQCYRGVCIMDMKQSPSCYSHRDCAATDQMCSGDSRCVDPVLQVGARECHL